MSALATKTCSRCGETKPLTAFHRHSRMLDGRRSDCAECARALTKLYQERKRAEIGDEAWREMTRLKVREHRERTGNERGKAYDRARYRASEALIRAHHSEFERLLAAELYEAEHSGEVA